MKATLADLCRAGLDAVGLRRVPVTTPAPGIWLLGTEVRIRRLPSSSRTRWAVDERHTCGPREQPDWTWMDAGLNRANAAYVAVTVLAYRERGDRIASALEKALHRI